MKINTIVVVTDNVVKQYYGYALRKAFKSLNCKIVLLSFPAGEKSKNINTVISLQTQMLNHFCSRETLIIALGGGVVGDIAGFVAATYMRGISYIQIPTTLLAMIDSSIGGKTGINLSHGKNLMGLIYKPKITIACIDFLASLPRKHIINGVVEALKVFLISNIIHFNKFRRRLNKILDYDKKSLETLVRHSANIKMNIIKQDLHENGLRAVLNFGHTIGHALEKISRYKILHGYAVAYGILFEAKISELLGILAPEKYDAIKTVFNQLGFHESYFKRFDVNSIIKATYSDKKARSNKINYVLLKDIGKIYSYRSSYTHPVHDKTIKKAFLTLIGEKYHAR